MCCCSNNASEGLVGYGTDIDHGEVMIGKLGMEVMEGDPGLRDNVSFLSINLGET